MSKFPVIPGYRITDTIGEGGMATVYKGIQEKLNREVAIKILEPSLLKNRTIAVRFLIEAETAANLSHTNIISIYDIGHKDDNQYIVMELLKETLKEHMYGFPDFRIKPEDALKILAPISEALDHAHSRGIIHRDIKTDNIMFRSDGVPVLTDFGIARALDSNSQMTRTGISLGTPYYMSPEQCQAEHMDGRSDFYSLGVVLYEILTGEKPFQADNPTAVALKHIQEPIPKLPEDLSGYQILIDKLLAKKAEDRVANGTELRRLMKDLLEGKDASNLLVEVAGELNLENVFQDTRTQAIPTITSSPPPPPNVPQSPMPSTPPEIKADSTTVIDTPKSVPPPSVKEPKPKPKPEPTLSKFKLQPALLSKKAPTKLIVESIVLAGLLVVIFFIFYSLGKSDKPKTLPQSSTTNTVQTIAKPTSAVPDAENRFRDQLDLATRMLEEGNLEKAREIVDSLKSEQDTPELTALEEQITNESAFNTYLNTANDYFEKREYTKAKENLRLAHQIKETPASLDLENKVNRLLGKRSSSRRQQNQKTPQLSAKEDNLAFEQAKKENSISAFRHYMDSYPSGQHISEAMSRLTNLQEAERLRKEAALKSKIKQTHLRSSYKSLSYAGAEAMIRKYNFFDNGFNKQGSFKNSFHERDLNGDKVIADQATGLMWYGGPNSHAMSFKKALRWIKNLNRKKYGGHADWRLPTLEETVSLLQKRRSPANLYISPLFPDAPPNTWTGDTMRPQTYWLVRFNIGTIFADSDRTDQFILPVRQGGF